MMIKSYTRVLLSLFLVLMLSSFVFAESFVIDQRYSGVNFKIDHAHGYPISGMFPEMEGTMEIGDKGLKKISGKLRAAKVQTGIPDMDEHLRDEGFFHTEKFQDITFKTKSVSTDKLTAEVTIKGKKKDVEFAYAFRGSFLDQYGRRTVVLSFSGSINRQDFGVFFNAQDDQAAWMLGDTVNLMIDVHGIHKSDINK